MDNHNPRPEKQIIHKSILIFSLLFLVVGTISIVSMTVFYYVEVDSHTRMISEEEKFSIKLQKRTACDVLDSFFSDLFLLVHQNELTDYLDNPTPETAKKIAREYLIMAEHKMRYNQIRFIDEYGREKIRVNYEHSNATEVEPAKLQDKSRRHYFTDSFSLDKGKIFLSPLDLNLEGGVIEEPFKPMIRIASPVFDSKGRKKGLILLNYFARELLDQIANVGINAPGDSMLLNSDGYWLLSPRQEDEWGFMIESRRNKNFARTFPLEWKKIITEKQGQFTTENGIFTFAAIYPLHNGYSQKNHLNIRHEQESDATVSQKYFWILLSHIPPSYLKIFSDQMLVRLIVFGTVLFAVGIIGAWFAALAISRRKIYQASLINMAHYDNLTGLPNRALFFDRLELCLSNALRYKRKSALLYIDLDGFKLVNDRIGHDGGDKLLKKISSRLKNCVRKSDTVSRLGGDEFAIILTEVHSRHDAVSVAAKIIKLLSIPVMIGPEKATVGASVGIAIFPDHSRDPEGLIKQADQAMYASKNRGKNRYTLSDFSDETN